MKITIAISVAALALDLFSAGYPQGGFQCISGVNQTTFDFAWTNVEGHRYDRHFPYLEHGGSQFSSIPRYITGVDFCFIAEDIGARYYDARGVNPLISITSPITAEQYNGLVDKLVASLKTSTGRYPFYWGSSVFENKVLGFFSSDTPDVVEVVNRANSGYINDIWSLTEMTASQMKVAQGEGITRDKFKTLFRSIYKMRQCVVPTPTRNTQLVDPCTFTVNVSDMSTPDPFTDHGLLYQHKSNIGVLYSIAIYPNYQFFARWEYTAERRRNAIPFYLWNENVSKYHNYDEEKILLLLKVEKRKTNWDTITVSTETKFVQYILEPHAYIDGMKDSILQMCGFEDNVECPERTNELLNKIAAKMPSMSSTVQFGDEIRIYVIGGAEIKPCDRVASGLLYYYDI